MTGRFSEKDFYLEEFRGRSIALAVPRPELVESAPVERVLADLAANRTRVDPPIAASRAPFAR